MPRRPHRFTLETHGFNGEGEMIEGRASIAAVAGREAAAVIARLDDVPRVRPLDLARAEDAISRFVAALGLAQRPLAWVPDARAGFLTAWSLLDTLPGGSDIRVATFQPLFGFKGMTSVARKGVRKAGRDARHRVHDAEEAVLHALAPAMSRLAPFGELTRAAWGAAQDKGLYARAKEFGVGTAGATADVQGEIRVANAAWMAAEAARWFAIAYVLDAIGRPDPTVERTAHAFLPLVDAVEAGVMLLWTCGTAVVAVAAPPAPLEAAG